MTICINIIKLFKSLISSINVYKDIVNHEFELKIAIEYWLLTDNE